MKKCSACSEKKSEDSFNWKYKARGIKQSRCKDCQRAYGRQHYKKNKLRYIEKAKKHNLDRRHIYDLIIYDHLKKHPCVDCGETDILVLEFDHVSGNKKFNISEKRWKGYSSDYLKEEISKCDVRCANCHRRKTAIGQSHWRYILMNVNYGDMRE